MLADPLLETRPPEAAEHGPELEGAEAAAEWDRDLAQVDRVVRGPQVLGTRLNALRKSSSRDVQRAEQSIGTPSHLCGLTPIESARSHPAKCGRSSGQTAADPRVGRVHVQPTTSAAHLRRRSPARGRQRRRPSSRSWRLPRTRRRAAGAPAEGDTRRRPGPSGARARAAAPPCPRPSARAPSRRPPVARGAASGRPRGGRARRSRRCPRCAPRTRPGGRAAAGASRGHLLELLQRRRRAPQDADLVEPCDEELREDPGLRAGRREVGEEARALPVREPGARTASRSRSTAANGSGESGAELGERRADGAGLDAREHRPLADAVQVGGDPVERERPVLAERAHAFFVRLCTSRHERVFSTCSFVSQARRAWATPSSA